MDALVLETGGGKYMWQLETKADGVCVRTRAPERWKHLKLWYVFTSLFMIVILSTSIKREHKNLCTASGSWETASKSSFIYFWELTYNFFCYLHLCGYFITSIDTYQCSIGGKNNIILSSLRFEIRQTMNKIISKYIIIYFNKGSK